MTSQIELAAIKHCLERKGWNQGEAAEAIGVTREHLNLVLNGRRTSRGLLKKIETLPEKQKHPSR